MFGLLKKLRAENLFRNTAFLIGNLMLTTGTGFGALTLLTHFFPVADVGLSGTALSSCMLVQNVTQFGITYSLPRFLPGAKSRSDLINTVLTSILLSTLLSSIIFLALPYARTFFALGGWLFPPLFIFAACVLATEMVLGTVLVADRAADKMAKANVAPNLIGLAAPIGLMLLGSPGSFIARVASDITSCILYFRLIVKRGHRFRPQLNFTGMREMIRFSGGIHVANLIGGLPQLTLPLIVLSRVGAKDAAYWSIAMTIASFLFQLPSLVIRALLPEVSHRPSERRNLFRRSALLVPVVVLPALGLAFFLSPIGLAAFGHSYVTGALGPLHWLIIAALVSMPLSVLGAILVVAKKSLMTTIANVVDAIVVIGMVELWAKNDNEIAVSWTVGEIGNILLFVLFAFLALREVHWRWEDLGGVQAVAIVGPLSRSISATGQLQGLARLVTLAEEQRTATDMYDMWVQRQYSLNDSRSLFAVTALRAAELRWAQNTSVRDLASPRPSSSPQLTGSDEAHRQAFDVLHEIAERQRRVDFFDPSDVEGFGRDYPYTELAGSELGGTVQVTPIKARGHARHLQ